MWVCALCACVWMSEWVHQCDLTAAKHSRRPDKSRPTPTVTREVGRRQEYYLMAVRRCRCGDDNDVSRDDACYAVWLWQWVWTVTYKKKIVYSYCHTRFTDRLSSIVMTINLLHQVTHYSTMYFFYIAVKKLVVSFLAFTSSQLLKFALTHIETLMTHTQNRRMNLETHTVLINLKCIVTWCYTLSDRVNTLDNMHAAKQNTTNY